MELEIDFNVKKKYETVQLILKKLHKPSLSICENWCNYESLFL